MLDAWGGAVAAADGQSVEAWNTAWGEALHFVGDPFGTLSPAIENDGSFALGSVFRATYHVLGGMPFDRPEIVDDIERARARARDARECGHVEALVQLGAGNFTAAAKRWDEVAVEARDFAAVRFAHDVYLHVGNIDDRLQSSARAVDEFDEGPGWNLVASQHAFSLEEAGRFDEAEQLAWRALDADEFDLWATHALAHVYESTDDQAAAMDLLRSRQSTWERQDALSVHIWWHLALRLIAGKQFDEVLDIHDALVSVATTPFRLSDLASMLWRLELAGVDVGDRWDHLANAYGERSEWHTSGFLDLHLALVYTRRPDHPAANQFFDGVATAHDGGMAENDDVFRSVVRPLVSAIRTGEADPAAAVATLERVAPTLHRVGGSIAQRELVGFTKSHYELTDREGT